MIFKVMTDEQIPNAVSEQLVKKGIDAVRVIDNLPQGTTDPDVLDYCHEHGYALITLDNRIRTHIADHVNAGKEHAGVFIAGNHLQGTKGIGAIVNFIVFYHESIAEGAATVENDVYNRIVEID